VVLGGPGCDLGGGFLFFVRFWGGGFWLGGELLPVGGGGREICFVFLKL